jgi:hypothetical protein
VLQLKDLRKPAVQEQVNSLGGMILKELEGLPGGRGELAATNSITIKAHPDSLSIVTCKCFVCFGMMDWLVKWATRKWTSWSLGVRSERRGNQSCSRK